MNLSVKDVQPKDNYLLLLTFENGEKRIFDMKPYLDFGIFEELKDVNIFKSVRISFDTIEWSNEADIDPKMLYQKSTRIQE